MGKREEFIKKSIKKHSDKYNYSKVEYIGSQTKVCIICPEHGEFWQTPANHVRGQGCPKCAKESNGKERRNTTENFIYNAIKVHGVYYNYSKTEYINARTKVCIICPEHGEFWQIPFAHLRGQGCPNCSGRNMDNELFIGKAKEVHGDKYDYSKVNYVNSKDKVCIICPEHGEFWQSPAKHLYGRGCPKCGKERNIESIKISLKEFIERSNKIHESIYDYSLIKEIESAHSKVDIICKKHGIFSQWVHSHLQGNGCPSCAMLESKGEREIYEFICDIIGCEKVERKNREILDGKEIDILIPSLGIGFEYNGLRWHSEEFGKDRYYHLKKTEECKNKGIKLYHIFEDEYLLHKDILLNKIRYILNISQELPKIYGRKCIIEKTDKETAKEFFDKFHIQGYGKSTLFLSCKYDNRIVGMMGFKRINDQGEWELTRFATDYNYICCGIGGKMFKYFTSNFNPVMVKSFADRRWSLEEDNLYIKMGFVLDNTLNPDYRYINLSNPKERIHKFNFRKSTLNNRYGLPLSMTESEMTKKLGYSKVWDCGLYRYIWKKPE